MHGSESLGHAPEVLARHFREGGSTHELHGSLRLLLENVERCLHPSLPVRGEAVQRCAANADGFRAECKRLENVRPTRDTAIEKDFEGGALKPGLRAQSLHHLHERLERWSRRVEVAAPVVAHHNPCEALTKGEDGVRPCLHAFEQNGRRCDAPDPSEVSPGEIVRPSPLRRLGAWRSPARGQPKIPLSFANACAVDGEKQRFKSEPVRLSDCSLCRFSVLLHVQLKKLHLSGRSRRCHVCQSFAAEVRSHLNQPCGVRPAAQRQLPVRVRKPTFGGGRDINRS
mmetsp:Transcript_24727/g.80863  ORF Transcript_24727/g.80863 Transcript_24727/m.80863 type:complete len:284 (-) Transcript_24727:1385-2236(-)